MSRSKRGAVCAGLLLSLAVCGGCGILGGGDGGSPSQDLSVAGGGDGGGGQGDMTAGPMDLNMSFVEVDWQLYNQNIMGGVGNATAINCDDPMFKVSQLVFTVTNGGGKSVMTTGPCAAGQGRGSVFVAIPDDTGPFVVGGAVVGRAQSSSEKIKNVMPARSITVRVFADGCDAPYCQ